MIFPLARVTAAGELCRRLVGALGDHAAPSSTSVVFATGIEPPAPKPCPPTASTRSPESGTSATPTRSVEKDANGVIAPVDGSHSSTLDGVLVDPSPAPTKTR